jgi:hypothetical protein
MKAITGQPSEAKTEENHKEEGGPKWTDIVVAGAAVGSLIFTVALWLSTRGLWVETRKLAAGAESQSDDLKKSISEATRSANALADYAAEAKRQTEHLSTQAMYMGDTLLATQRMAAGAETTASWQLRAYINVERIFTQRVPNGRLVIVRIRNFGKTPAYDVQATVGIQITQYPFGQQTLLPLSMGERSRDTLGPTACQDLPLWLDDLNTAPQDQAIVNKVLAVLVRGLITYRDAFGKQRETNLRHFSQGDPWREGNFCADSQGNDCN